LKAPPMPSVIVFPAFDILLFYFETIPELVGLDLLDIWFWLKILAQHLQ